MWTRIANKCLCWVSLQIGVSKKRIHFVLWSMETKLEQLEARVAALERHRAYSSQPVIMYASTNDDTAGFIGGILCIILVTAVVGALLDTKK